MSVPGDVGATMGRWSFSAICIWLCLGFAPPVHADCNPQLGDPACQPKWGPPAPPPPPPPPPPMVKPVTTFIVFFDFNKSNLTAEAEAVVADAVKVAKSNGFVKVLVTGHTDTVGSDSYNMGLSVRRAE